MSYTAATGTKVGHIHLRVSDLDRSIAFYRDVMGFEVTQNYGGSAAFMSVDGYHHHIGLNTWESRGGVRPPKGHTGIYHVAFLYPTREALAKAAANAVDYGVQIYGRADHGVSLAIYFDDPDGNGLELYWDRPPEAWPRNPDGTLAMFTRRLDLAALRTEVDARD